ncbi:MAG TPA: hypothetical protein VMY05_00805 [Acidobacteriota bacterium]|nr:hypothetical protein [Acidobacteriota bacterium]
MESAADLKKLERKAYLSYLQDGIWDTLFGLGILSFGVLMFLDLYYLVGAVVVVLWAVAIGAKKRFTQPRLGYVRFSPEREALEGRNRTVLMVLLWVAVLLGGALALAWGTSSGVHRWARAAGLMPMGIVLAGLVGAVGLLWGIRRYVVYAVIILVGFAGGHVLDVHPKFYFTAIGAVILLTGLIMMVQFLRKYPKPKGEEFAGERP